MHYKQVQYPLFLSAIIGNILSDTAKGGHRGSNKQPRVSQVFDLAVPLWKAAGAAMLGDSTRQVAKVGAVEGKTQGWQHS